MPSDDVRAECRRRFGDEPCTNVLDAKGKVIGTVDCTDWCPLLRCRIEEEEDDADIGSNAASY